MKVTDDLKQFLTYSQKFIGTRLLLTDLEKSIVEVALKGEMNFEQRPITEELKNLAIGKDEILLKDETNAFPLIVNHEYKVNAEMIAAIYYKDKHIGYLVYHTDKGEFEEAHKEYGMTGKTFVEKLIAKHYESE